jgi:dihydropteroate synthase
MLSKTQIMGVINITPDSFSDGGKYLNPIKAINLAKQMIEQGVDIIDIGGESSKPGAIPITADEEIDRVIPVLEAIKNNFDVIVSIDTYKQEVMDLACEYNVDIINDIFALRKIKCLKKIAKLNKKIILMHMFENPETMQKNYHYQDIIQDIISFFDKRISFCLENNIKKENIILDPGFGFGKSVEHNFKILHNLAEFKKLGLPVLIGVSRKSSISKIINKKPCESDNGTTVLNTIAILNKVNYLRVHNVDMAKEAVELVHKYKNTNNLY